MTKKIQALQKDGRPLSSLNELEIIKDVRDGIDLSNYAFANQFLRNYTYLVNLKTGRVIHMWDLSELTKTQMDYSKRNGLTYTQFEKGNVCLNGIAYYKPNDSFIMTGKLWDLSFEIKLDYMKYIKEDQEK